MTTTEILLVLFIINLGVVFGAGLYETRIVLPLWFNKSTDGTYYANFENLRKIDTGRKFWGFAATVPLTLITFANLILAIQSQQPLYNWWLATSILVLVERIGTFTFFIPTALRLSKGDNLPKEKLSSLIFWWIQLNYIRIVMTFFGLLLSIKTLLTT